MSARLEGRNGDVWQAYAVKGWTQERCAEHFGVSRERIGQILRETRESIPAPDKAELIALSVETLLEMRRRAYEMIDSTPAPVFVGKDGAIARDEHGEVVRDYSLKLAALEFNRKIDDTIAKRLGLDAATKTESTATVKYTIEGVNPEDLT